MKYFILLTSVLFFVSNLQAQEFVTTVTINTPKLQTTDPKVFQTLQQTIKEFMNNQTWTDQTYENFERIKVNFTINIREEVNANTFKGDLYVQMTRPVFGSDYETPVFSVVDKDFAFSYEQFQPLQFSRGVFVDNLSAMLAFYAFFMLGQDADTFTSLSGETYYLAAQEILNNVPRGVSANFTGWLSVDGNRTRYFQLENALNPGMRAVRQGMYDYHRKGLDLMSSDPITARANMLKGLELCEAVNKSYPNSMVIQLLGSTKANEIINVFKGGDQTQRAKVTQIMSKLDPAGSQRYLQLAF